MNFYTILHILLIHWLADFALQTNDQATQKSKSIKWLFYHVGVYSVMWLIMSYYLFGDWEDCVIFALITFGAHFVTDFITSRIGRPFWEKQDYHNGFTLVGFDQVLHYMQLFLTYETLIK